MEACKTLGCPNKWDYRESQLCASCSSGAPPKIERRPKCSADNCVGSPVSNGLCGYHYEANREVAREGARDARERAREVAFLDLARQLRDLGATRVIIADKEVHFGAQPRAEAPEEALKRAREREQRKAEATAGLKPEELALVKRFETLRGER
jgi:hypothetical protein